MESDNSVSKLDHYLDQIIERLDNLSESLRETLPGILDINRYAGIPFMDRVLLLSHCLRPGDLCPAKFKSDGLNCPDDCDLPCVIGKVRRAALSLGYKGVSIAAGGSMALRYIKEKKPRGILAVACFRELSEGVEAVVKSVKNLRDIPAIVVVQLTRDGCINTEVDERELMDALVLASGQ